MKTMVLSLLFLSLSIFGSTTGIAQPTARDIRQETLI